MVAASDTAAARDHGPPAPPPPSNTHAPRFRLRLARTDQDFAAVASIWAEALLLPGLTELPPPHPADRTQLQRLAEQTAERLRAAHERKLRVKRILGVPDARQPRLDVPGGAPVMGNKTSSPQAAPAGGDPTAGTWVTTNGEQVVTALRGLLPSGVATDSKLAEARRNGLTRRPSVLVYTNRRPPAHARAEERNWWFKLAAAPLRRPTLSIHTSDTAAASAGALAAPPPGSPRGDASASGNSALRRLHIDHSYHGVGTNYASAVRTDAGLGPNSAGADALGLYRFGRSSDAAFPDHRSRGYTSEAGNGLAAAASGQQLQPPEAMEAAVHGPLAQYRSQPHDYMLLLPPDRAASPFAAAATADAGGGPCSSGSGVDSVGDTDTYTELRRPSRPYVDLRDEERLSRSLLLQPPQASASFAGHGSSGAAAGAFAATAGGQGGLGSTALDYVRPAAVATRAAANTVVTIPGALDRASVAAPGHQTASFGAAHSMGICATKPVSSSSTPDSLVTGVAPRRSRGGGGATDPRHQQHTDSFDPQQDFSTDPDLNDDDDDAGGWRAPSGDSDDLAPVSAAAALGEDGSTAAAAASLIIFTKRRPPLAKRSVQSKWWKSFKSAAVAAPAAKSGWGGVGNGDDSDLPGDSPDGEAEDIGVEPEGLPAAAGEQEWQHGGNSNSGAPILGLLRKVASLEPAGGGVGTAHDHNHNDTLSHESGGLIRVGNGMMTHAGGCSTAGASAAGGTGGHGGGAPGGGDGLPDDLEGELEVGGGVVAGV
eukprot:XP_001690428.1 predicted protein [Chlamydomonas reinhardtii]